MKNKIQKSIVLFLIVMYMASCRGNQEVGPIINFKNYAELDTSYNTAPPNAEIKNVLIEESTGTKCPNCPTATKLLENLNASNNNRLVVCSIHFGIGISSLNIPYTGDPDLRPNDTVGTDYITGVLGGIQNQPQASIDRYKNSSNLLMSNSTSWPSQINFQLSKTTPVNIDLALTNNQADKVIYIDFKVTYNTDKSTDSNDYYTIILVENKLKGKQDSVSLPDPIKDYEWHNVFRGFLTASTGELLNKITFPRNPGRVYHKILKVKYEDLKSSRAIWNVSNLTAIAFVHKNNILSKEVIQVKEDHIN